MLNRLTDSINFQSEALKLRSERQRLIASNIANADTPGYLAKDFNFSTALKQATGVGSSGQGLSTPTLQLSAGNAQHLRRDGSAAGGAVQPELSYATQSQDSLDRNTVDMDRERAAFADNTIRYEATLRFINGQMKTLNTAINGQ